MDLTITTNQKTEEDKEVISSAPGMYCIYNNSLYIIIHNMRIIVVYLYNLLATVYLVDLLCII